MVVGVTGNTGCGKSRFARLLADLIKGHIIDVDSLAHEVLEKDGTVRNKLQRSFGTSIVTAAGSVDRSRLAAMAFTSRDRVELLNSAVWPAMLKRLESEIDRWKKEGKEIIIVDMAVLFEAKSEALFDVIIVVTSSIRNRMQRLRIYRDWSDAEIKQRMARQMDLDEKIALADIVIYNDESMDELEKKAQTTALELLGRKNP